MVFGDHVAASLLVRYLVYLRLALHKLALQFLLDICREIIALGKAPLDVAGAFLDLVQGNAWLCRVAMRGWFVALKVLFRSLVRCIVSRRCTINIGMGAFGAHAGGAAESGGGDGSVE